MNASILPRLRLFGVASILVLAASAAVAQTDEKAQSAPKSGSTAKTTEKPEAAAKKPAKPAGRRQATRPRPKLAPIAKARLFGWTRITSNNIRAPANMAASPVPSPARRAELQEHGAGGAAYPPRIWPQARHPSPWRMAKLAGAAAGGAAFSTIWVLGRLRHPGKPSRLARREFLLCVTASQQASCHRPGLARPLHPGLPVPRVLLCMPC